MDYDSAYRVCDECGDSYYYFDSPAQNCCFCGHTLRPPTEEDMAEIVNRLSAMHTATVSC